MSENAILNSFWKYYNQGVDNRCKWEATQNIDGHIEVLKTANRNSNFSEMLKSATRLSEFTNYTLGTMRYFSREEFLGQYDMCKERFPDFDLTYTNSNLSEFRWKMRVILKQANAKANSYFELDLGLFEIKFYTSNDYPMSKAPYKQSYFSIYKHCYAYPVGENKPKSIAGAGSTKCYHPHISGANKLCLGGYGNDNTMYRDIDAFNIWSIIYNISSLINNYNAGSLNFNGADISYWIGQKCPVCYQFCDNDNVIMCAKTKMSMHKDCGVEIDKLYYNPSSLATCTLCKKETAYYIPYSSDKILCSACDSLPEVKPQPNQEILI